MAVSKYEEDVDIDLGRLAGAVWRRKIAIAIVVAVAGGAAALVTATLHPRYKSETRILIETREPAFISGQGKAVPEQAFDERAVTSQVEILKSADLIKKVALDLDLAARAEFDPAADPSLVTRALVTFGLAKDPLEVPPEERVLKRFYEKLEVYAVPSSRVIAVTFSSEDPELAARIPNALADAYLAFNAGLKLKNNSDASAWLEPEIADLREKVRESEEKIARYRAEKGLLLVNEKDTIAARQLADLSTELGRVRSERADAEARARAVRAALESGQGADTLSEVLGSSNVQRLREREASLSAQIADLSATLLDEHPRMKALRAQREDVRRQVAAETGKVLKSLENNARLARLREEELTAQLNTLKSGSAREGEETVELRSMEREAAAQRDLLETYLGRYREAASRTEPASTPADARVISRAVPAGEAYFPKTVPIIVVSALAAFLLSAIWVMLAELFSGRALRRSEGAEIAADIEAAADRDAEALAAVMRRYPPAPAAVTDATAATDAPDPVAAQPPSLLSAEPEGPLLPGQADPEADFSVESVAASLLAEEVAVAICVSPEGDEGSVSAVMLARTAAGEGARTLLIDLTGSGCPTDLMAETPELVGLTDILCGEVSIAEAIHADRLSPAQIVPLGRSSARRAMRAIDRLPMIIDALVTAYDLVIVECGAAAAESVARIARRSDAEIVLSVVRPDEAAIMAALGAFREQGFDDVMLMTPARGPDGPGRRRAAA